MIAAVRAAYHLASLELALCGSMLAKNPTRKALGDTMLGNDMIHTGTAAGGAYQFPEAAVFEDQLF